MSGAMLVILSFFAGTGITWTLLWLFIQRRSKPEERLRRYGAQKQQLDPSAVSPSGNRKLHKRPLRLFSYQERKKRRKMLEAQILDALTVMSSSLKAGYSFLQAMEMAARECPDPLGEEFRLTLHEMSLGATVEDSLMELAHRAEVDDLDLVLTAVMIQRQVGGNLAEVLDNIAGTIRERMRIRGEIQTLTAQGRISGWIVGLLPMAILLFVSVLNPGYLRPMFQHPLGWLLLGMGLSGQLVGAMMIKKIINIEV